MGTPFKSASRRLSLKRSGMDEDNLSTVPKQGEGEKQQGIMRRLVCVEGQMGPPPVNGDFVTIWLATLALSEQLAAIQAWLQVVLGELHNARKGLVGTGTEIRDILGIVSRTTAQALKGQADALRALSVFNEMNAAGRGRVSTLRTMPGN